MTICSPQEGQTYFMRIIRAARFFFCFFIGFRRTTLRSTRRQVRQKGLSTTFLAILAILASWRLAYLAFLFYFAGERSGLWRGLLNIWRERRDLAAAS
jgi:hypothetical protein